MTRASRIRLWIFLLIGAVAVVNAGAHYAGLTDRLLPTTYQVRVDLADSGGLFERGEVTYRGFTVGRVERLDFRTDGVVATLAIGRKWRIPADLAAEVHNRSAVGEQYVDLVPRTDAGPYLHEGSTIPVADTSTPVDENELIVASHRLLASIDTADLATVVDETGTAFDGAGGDLGRLLDNSATLVGAARDALPATRALLRSGSVVLGTQAAQASTIAGYLHDLAGVTGVVAARDGEVRAVLSRGTAAALQLTAFARQLAPVLPPLLSDLVDLAAITAARRAGLEETLVAVPWALASAQTPGREGRAHFTFVGGSAPSPCRKGYVPAGEWRSPQDTSVATLPSDIGCADSSVPRGGNSVHPRSPAE